MTAIVTRFHGATNYKGSRISASTTMRDPRTKRPSRLVLDYDHALDSSDNHRMAALTLLTKLGWKRLVSQTVAGETPTGYVFCFVRALDEQVERGGGVQ